MTDCDIFDFKKYKNTYKLFEDYFEGVELYLRCAIFIDYCYNYNLNKNDRKILFDELNKLSDKKLRKKLEELTDVFENYELLSSWYDHFSPNLDNEDNLDFILKKYEFCESVLFNRLYKKYVDNNWKEIKLWFYTSECDKRR